MVITCQTLLEFVAKPETPDVAALYAATPGVPLHIINQLWNTPSRKSATPGVQRPFAAVSCGIRQLVPVYPIQDIKNLWNGTAMIKMMITFFKDLWKYRSHVRKQNRWIRRFAKRNNYVVNPNLMMSTNLEIWLAEMEETFGKRYCPCFEPSADPELNKRMLCPCNFIDDEIAEYGTCHCSLFGSATLSKAGWQQSSQRLMKEYRIPLKLVNGVLDTRGMPLDSRRHLPVPDAMHQLKSALNTCRGQALVLLVEREQEAENLDKIARYRGYGVHYEKIDDYYRVAVTLDGSTPQGTSSGCGG